jgi:hypothetical protein
MQEGFMLKKSLIFVSVALFLAALITLTGCPTTTDDDGGAGITSTRHIYGGNVSPYAAQAIIDDAIAAGAAVILEHGLTLNAAGHLNFKTAQVRVEGVVTFVANSAVSMADAAVTWADGAFLTLPAPSAYIHRRGDDISKVTAGAPVEFVNSLNEIMPRAGAAAVRRFKLGPKPNYDYSVDPNGIDAKVKAAGLTDLYVLDELVIDNTATLPVGLKLTAMGTVDITGTPPATVIVGTLASLPLGTCSTLTTSKGGVTVPVVATTTIIPNIKVDAGKNFSIQQATAGTLEIRGKLTGAGTLAVLGAATDITINGGNGNIRFPDAAAPAALNIASTGTVIFDDDVTTLTGAKSTIRGDVVFRGDVTTAHELDLFGNVTLVSGKVLTLSANPVTLGAGKSVSVEYTLSNAAAATAPVLTAGPGPVVLTPAGASKLTAAGSPKTESDAKKLTLTVAGLTITDGTLRVAPGASLALDGFALTTGPVATTAVGYLAVADGGSVILVGAGSVVIGDTAVTVASTLRAAGGTVTLGNNKITGDVAGAALTVPTGSPVFTLTGIKLLTLERAELILEKGSVILAAVGGRLILDKQAKITLTTTEGGIPTDRTRIGSAATLSGDLVGLTAPGSTTNQTVWSVAQGGTGEASIAATAATFTLSKSSRFTTN